MQFSQGMAPEQHPEPRHIFKLWQIFVERVNPLIKIVHVPTIQQRIMDASWGAENLPPSTTALLFSIYSLAVMTLSSSDCEDLFGNTKNELLQRYRSETSRSLMAADLLLTRELETLQAFVLFLIADSESEQNSTLSVLAMRIAQKMGLHLDKPIPRVSCFETEMRIRLWWQLRIVDARARQVIPNAGWASLPPECDDVRLPLNVNDADLHTDMTEHPAEHTGPTEMIHVLLKYEVYQTLRSCQLGARIFPSHNGRGIVHGPQFNSCDNDEILASLARAVEIYEDKYLRHCDPKIPLHSISIVTAGLAMARLRFKLHHPRSRPDGGAGMTKEECDSTFEDALLFLELGKESRNTQFAYYLFCHLSTKHQMDGYIFVISELRRRLTGDRVSVAWRLVEGLYEDNPQLLDDADHHAFYAALGDLTLEAWDAHRRGIAQLVGNHDNEAPPNFIAVLRSKRGKDIAGGDGGTAVDVTGEAVLQDVMWDWDGWE